MAEHSEEVAGSAEGWAGSEALAAGGAPAGSAETLKEPPAGSAGTPEDLPDEEEEEDDSKDFPDLAGEDEDDDHEDDDEDDEAEDGDPLRRGSLAVQEIDAMREEAEALQARMRGSSRSLIPSYPFPADFHLEFQGSRIEAIRHLCPLHPEGTRAVAVFFPGVHGGVGPCRTPGENFCPNALFPTVARGLVEVHRASIDCYRISWPFMRPRLAYAVGGACRVLHHALLEAMKNTPPSAPNRELRVLFVGHSLGGAVALQAAEVVARHFGADGEGGQKMEGLERAVVRVAGVCTLNGAFGSDQDTEALGSLCGSRALLISGTADEVVPPSATKSLLEALPMQDKRLLELTDGTHDLYAYKDQLVHEVTSFLLESAGLHCTSCKG